MRLVYCLYLESVHDAGGDSLNKNMLLGIMKSHGDTQAILAKSIGISTQNLNSKINAKNGAEFKRGEIQAIKDRYNLDNDTLGMIFFTPAVS